MLPVPVIPRPIKLTGLRKHTLTLLPTCSRTQDRKGPIQNTNRMLEWQKMYQVDQVKLTKYGFRFNLLRSSSFLSVLGIVVSIIGIIGSIGCFLVISKFGSGRSDHGLTVIHGAVLLILMISYLAMWILLKIKTSKQDIFGIEMIGKVYSYVSGVLEIISAFLWIILSARTLLSVPHNYRLSSKSDLVIGVQIVDIIGSVIYFVSACLKFMK